MPGTRTRGPCRGLRDLQTGELLIFWGPKVTTMDRRVHRRSFSQSLAFLSLSVLLGVSGASKYIEDPESFPGWKGELPGTALDASPDNAVKSNAGSDNARAHMVNDHPSPPPPLWIGDLQLLNHLFVHLFVTTDKIL